MDCEQEIITKCRNKKIHIRHILHKNWSHN